MRGAAAQQLAAKQVKQRRGGEDKGEMRGNNGVKEQMREVQEIVWTERAGTSLPLGRCSQGCHRRCVWCRPQTCPPCTSQSLLSLCGPGCQAAHYPALDP